MIISKKEIINNTGPQNCAISRIVYTKNPHFIGIVRKKVHVFALTYVYNLNYNDFTRRKVLTDCKMP